MKVYIPTMEELEKLQALGVNTYRYIVAKVIEALIMEDIVYAERDIFEIFENLTEHPEIIYGICKLYPTKVSESIITSKDPELCRKLLERIPKEDNTIYKLDDILMSFDESILFDVGIIKNTASLLASHLSSCPKYRFHYMGPNILLDSIFACEIPSSKILPESYDNFVSIDPIYSVKICSQLETKKGKTTKESPFLIRRGMAVYTGRYGLDEYIGREYQNKDIINKPDEKVKKLIRCLEEHKHNYN